MEHMGSISGHFMAGYDGWNIDYVGKVEQFGEHWSVLSQEITECKTGYLEKYWDQKQGEESSTKRKLRGEGHRDHCCGQDASCRTEGTSHIESNTGRCILCLGDG